MAARSDLVEVAGVVDDAVVGHVDVDVVGVRRRSRAVPALGQGLRLRGQPLHLVGVGEVGRGRETEEIGRHWRGQVLDARVRSSAVVELPVEIELDEFSYEVDLVISDADAYDAFYGVIANPQLWFTQHYLWDLSNAPDIRADEKLAWNKGYKVVNDDIAREVLRQIEGRSDPLVMFHDYHLYVTPGLVRERVPDATMSHFVHIPWPGPDAWRTLPPSLREPLLEGLLGCDVVAFHTEADARAAGPAAWSPWRAPTCAGPTTPTIRPLSCCCWSSG